MNSGLISVYSRKLFAPAAFLEINAEIHSAFNKWLQFDESNFSHFTSVIKCGMYFRKEDSLIPFSHLDHLCARNKFRFNSTSVYSAINKLKAELNFRKREISLPSGCRDKRLMAVLIPFWRENQNIQDANQSAAMK